MQMKSIYTSFKCGSCKKEIILLTNEVEEALKHGKYLACTYCSSKHLNELKQTYSIKECFVNSEKAR